MTFELPEPDDFIAEKIREKEIEKADEIRTSLFVDNERKIIVEQIYKDKKSMFCIYDHNTKEIEYKNEYFEDGVVYRPLEGEEVDMNVIKLPTEATVFENEDDLDKEILDFIHTWLDIPEDIMQFALWNVKRSWVFQRFHTLNYLRALGDTGQGKTRFLDSLGYIHYKPIATSGASTSAPIFRIINKWRGTLIIDEADFQKSDEAQEIIKIINMGYEKDKYIMRCDKDDNNMINFFDPFCPKILATRRSFKDKAVESRCITQVMAGTRRTDINWNLNSDFWDAAMRIRNKLLYWRMITYFEIDPKIKIDFDMKDLEPRVQQVVQSFASLFQDDPEKKEMFKEFVENHQENLIEERRTSFDGEIVCAVHDLVSDGYTHLSNSDIIERGNLTNFNGGQMSGRALSSKLKALGFQKPIVERVNGEVKRCIPLEDKHLENLFKRYGFMSPNACNTSNGVTNVTNVRRASQTDFGVKVSKI